MEKRRKDAHFVQGAVEDATHVRLSRRSVRFVSDFDETFKEIHSSL